MKTIRRFISQIDFGQSHGARFDRYYSNLLRAADGGPTADEARKDLLHRDAHTPFGWPR